MPSTATRVSRYSLAATSTWHSTPPSGFPVPQSTMAILGAAGVVKDDSYVFVDRFETGDESGWSSSLP